MGAYNHLERGTWSGNQADLVVILLHGMSGNSARTIVYAEELAERLPRTTWAGVRRVATLCQRGTKIGGRRTWPGKWSPQWSPSNCRLFSADVADDGGIG